MIELNVPQAVQPANRSKASRRLDSLRYGFLTILLAGCSALASGQTPQVTKDSLHTIAGDLKILELKANCQFNVTLNDKIILKTNCDDESTAYYATPEPTIHTFYKSLAGLGEFEEVVLFQMQMLGNACDGGDLIFLGLKKYGSFSLSNSIDFCGGRPPVVTWGTDKVTVFIPGGPPNRGRGYLPSETWVYEKGKVTKLKTRAGSNPKGCKESSRWSESAETTGNVILIGSHPGGGASSFAVKIFLR